jgi:hypothetical protein
VARRGHYATWHNGDVDSVAMLRIAHFATTESTTLPTCRK